MYTELFFLGYHYSLKTVKTILPSLQELSILNSPISPFTIGPRALYNILRSKCFSFAQTFTYVARYDICIHCMRFSGSIKSSQNIGHAHYSDVTDCDLKNTSLYGYKYHAFSFSPLLRSKSLQLK